MHDSVSRLDKPCKIQHARASGIGLSTGIRRRGCRAARALPNSSNVHQTDTGHKIAQLESESLYLSNEIVNDRQVCSRSEDILHGIVPKIHQNPILHHKSRHRCVTHPASLMLTAKLCEVEGEKTELFMLLFS